MHLKCGEIFNGCIIAGLLLIALVKEFKKNGQHLAKLWTRVGCTFLLTKGLLCKNGNGK